MAGRLAGKVAVITGGCSGIGLGAVELFHAEDARIVVADVQDVKGKALEERLSGVRFARCDVTREGDIAAAIELAVQTFGGLDILFNNAGAGGAGDPVEMLAADDWDRTMALLLRSVMLGIKHAVKPMRTRGGGAIINTASIAGERAGLGSIAYGVAKAGVIHLTQMAATELAADRIRVNAISPGMIATSIFGAALGMERDESDRIAASLPPHMAKLQPLPKPGLPEDIANACLFLASAQSAFVTGVSIPVDGGFLIGRQISVDPEDPNSLFHALTIAKQASG